MARISVLAHKFRVKIKKKGLRREILAFVLVFTRVFRPRTRFYSRLGGGTSSIFGCSGPKMHSSGTGLVVLFWGTILARRGTFLAWGAQAVILGAHGPKMPPVAPGLGYKAPKYTIL